MEIHRNDKQVSTMFRIRSMHISIVFLLCFSQFVFAERTVGKFLNINTSARDTAIGEVAVSLGNDIGAIDRNPAGAGFIEQSQLYTYYNHYWNKINHAYTAFAVRVWRLAFGGTATYFGTPEIAITDTSGNSTGARFSQTGIASGFFLAARFVPFLSIGTNLKYVKEDIGESSFSALATDYGLLFDIYGLRIGFAYGNAGSEVKYGEERVSIIPGGQIYITEKFKLPETIRFGLGFSNWGLSIGTELSSQVNGEDLGLGVGAEWWIANIICPRIGYRRSIDATTNIFSAGLGLRLGPLQFEYTFVPHPQLGDSHRAAFSILFGKPKEPVKPLAPEVPPTEVVKSTEPVQVVEPPVAPKPTPLIEKPTVQINVAVADFTAKGVSASDASTITDFVRTELVGVGYYNVMDRANMEMILTEQKFQLSGCTEQECAVKMGKMLSVKLMIVGALSKLLDTYYITASVVDVETGKILKSVREKALTADELSNACRSIAEQLCQ